MVNVLNALATNITPNCTAGEYLLQCADNNPSIRGEEVYIKREFFYFFSNYFYTTALCFKEDKYLEI